jgi:hypothetical protein
LTNRTRRLTGVDDVVLVSKVKSQQELGGKPAHNWIGDHALFEPSAKALHRLPHELEHETNMGSVRPFVFEVVDEVADILVA